MNNTKQNYLMIEKMLTNIFRADNIINMKMNAIKNRKYITVNVVVSSG